MYPTTSRKRLARVAQRPARGIDQADLPLHVQLLDLHLAQKLLLDLLLHAHARQEGHALIVLHHLADGLDGGHLHGHAQRHFVRLKLAEHHFAVGRDTLWAMKFSAPAR
jgi:hypothetical protein